jgi:benzil reductase ((S)-benzoin forming)
MPAFRDVRAAAILDRAPRWVNATIVPMNLYIVTGTTRGLGAALAARIAADPANLLICFSRSAEGPIPGGRQVAVDLATRAELSAACLRAEQHFAGQPIAKAVLINNAGIVSPVAPLDQCDEAELIRNMRVNLEAPLRLMRWFIRATPDVAVRRIINISSGAGRRPIFGWSAYCTAKAGLDMASRTVALECETRGMAVDVVSLAPGVIDTPMQAVVRGASAEDFVDVDRFRAMKEDGTLRPPEEVAADILRLEAEGKLRGEALQDLRSLA